MSETTLLKVENVAKSFHTPEGQTRHVLQDVNFELKEGEFVAVLGKSGSGKSTFLRILAGLIKPSNGTVFYKDNPVVEPVKGIAMVFQNFALLPWLSVLENVELGLEAQGMNSSLRRQKALQAIDMVGLDGFESAYPKELSGGMRQRVGFARALVVEPELLVMDEPFSALDILTAENLRNDLMELWQEQRIRTKSILCVTHDIEEAILMANRIVIFSSDPGRIHTSLNVDLPFPRIPQSEVFHSLVDKIYTVMTTSERDRLALTKAAAHRQKTDVKHPEYAYRLPDVSVSELTGLLEAMQWHLKEGRIDLPALADELHLAVDNLFPLTEALDMLRFAKISKGEVKCLGAGKELAEGDILERKHLFAKHLLEHIPLARHIREVLDLKPNHRVNEEQFLEELQEFLTEDESERLLKIIIDWSRYAEIFAYDYDTGVLSLENPQ